TPDDNALAQKFFQRAIDLDPTFSGAYVGLTMAHAQAADFQTRGLPETQSSIEALARRAPGRTSAHAGARSRLSAALWRRGDYEGALAEAERALATTPNLAHAHHALAQALIFSGRPKEGLAALKRSIRLDPRDPHSATRLNHMALGHYFSREYVAAVEVAKRAIRSYPDFPNTYRWLAAALGQLGRTVEAEARPAEGMAIMATSFAMYIDARVQ